MGRLPHEMADVPERDVQMMMLYASRHHLPVRRLQLQMALAAKVMGGGTDRSLTPYLFDYVRPEVEAASNDAPSAAMGAEQLAATGGSSVRMIGRKLKGRR